MMSPSPPESIKRLVQLGLAAGLEADAGRRPGEAEALVPRRRVTGLRSRWLHRRCEVCGHSFRLGDEVLLLPAGPVVHDLPGLRCAAPAPAAPAAEPAPTGTDATAEAFYAGLITAWPLPDEVPLTRLTPGHWLLAPPERGHRRAACGVCGHSFRPFDLVVICPCDPLNPRCRAAVHRDVLKQLHCWDHWQQSPHRHNACIGMS